MRPGNAARDFRAVEEDLAGRVAEAEVARHGCRTRVRRVRHLECADRRQRQDARATHARRDVGSAIHAVCGDGRRLDDRRAVRIGAIQLPVLCADESRDRNDRRVEVGRLAGREVHRIAGLRITRIEVRIRDLLAEVRRVRLGRRVDADLHDAGRNARRHRHADPVRGRHQRLVVSKGVRIDAVEFVAYMVTNRNRHIAGRELFAEVRRIDIGLVPDIVGGQALDVTADRHVRVKEEIGCRILAVRDHDLLKIADRPGTGNGRFHRHPGEQRQFSIIRVVEICCLIANARVLRISHADGGQCMRNERCRRSRRSCSPRPGSCSRAAGQLRRRRDRRSMAGP